MLGGFLAVVEQLDLASKSKGVVAAFWAFFALLGIKKCFSILKRPATSSMCVSGLIFALFAYFFLQLFQVMRNLLGIHHPLLLFGMMLAVLVLAIVGVTLSVLGLRGYAHSFSRDGVKLDFVQGRAQARWGLVLGLFFSLMMVLGSYRAFMGAGKPLRSLTQVKHKKGELSDYVFKDKNFRLNLPDSGKSWVEMDYKKIMPDSTIILRKRSPQIFFTVIAETLGVETGMTTDDLVELSQSNMKAMSSSVTSSEVTPLFVNGLAGQTYTANARVGAIDLSYRFWCFTEKGYSYQLVLWTKKQNERQLVACANKMLDSFELIDPSKTFYLSGNKGFGRQESERFAYSIDLQKSSWMNWELLHDSDELADRGGVMPDGTRFSLTAVALPVAGSSLEMVYNGMLGVYDVENSLLETPPKLISVSGMKGFRYAYSNTDNRCVEQVLWATNCAYLVSVWCPKADAAGLDAKAAKVFDAVSFGTPDLQKMLAGISVAEQAAQAKMLNQMGLVCYSAGRYPEAVKWFRLSVQYAPTNTTYFANILAGYFQLNQNAEGLALLAKADAAVQKDPSVMSWQAALLNEKGEALAADAVYTKLFKTDYRDDDDFISWTTLRANNGLWEGMDELCEHYFGKTANESLRVHLQDLYYKKGDYKKVVDLTQAYLDQYGFSSQVALSQVDAYQGLGLYKEAVAVCNRLIAKGHLTVRVYQEKAYSEYELKWYRKAKKTFELALKLNPENDVTKEWLQQVSAELGEGDNSCLKEVIDPVPLPSELKDLFSVEPPKGFGEAFGACYSSFLTLWAYEKDKSLKRTSMSRIKILDETGVSAFSSIEYPFSPVSQNIFVNRVVVRDEMGKVVARGAVKDFYVVDDHDSGLISEDKKLVIPVPSLQPGFTLEVVVTRTYGSKPSEFYFKRSFLAASFPIFKAAVTLTGAVENVTSIPLNGVVETRHENRAWWTNAAPVVYRREPLQIPVERFLPIVVLGPKNQTWESCGLDYLKEIKEHLVLSDSERKQAQTLTKGCATPVEKYRAIINWIRASITYKPLEFGRNATIPDVAADTLKFRYGDCKDLSVLLKAMLQAVGIECTLVLANTADDIYSQLPTTDQFNHMITYLSQIQGGIFVDPTDQTADALLPVPDGLQNKKVLLLDSSQPTLKTIPAYRPDSSNCSIQRIVSVGEGNRVEIVDQINLTGYYASWLRSSLKARQKIKWVEWAQLNIADFVPGLEVKSVEADDLNDNSKTLQVKMTYALQHAVSLADTRLALKVPSIWVRYYISAPRVPARKNPFRRSHPFGMNVAWEIRPPKGFVLRSPALDQNKSDTPFLTWSAGFDKTHRYVFNSQFKVGDFSVQQYQAFTSTLHAAQKAANLDVVLVPQK